MSTPTQQETFRFIAFRLGDQTFAIDAAAVVSAHETGVVNAVSSKCLAGSCGTLTYEGQDLPVVRAADCLGIDDRGHDGRGHFIIVRNAVGRLALQIRGMSRALKIPVTDSRALPRPLDRLVGDRYSAILKWSAVVHEQGDKTIVWDAKRQEKQEELFLLVNHEIFLRNQEDHPTKPNPVDSPAIEIESSNDIPQVSTAELTSKQRLFLFSPAMKAQGERPYRFGMSAAQVMEVSRPLPIVPVPGASSHVVGVVNWREEIVPVLRMAEMLGLEGVGSMKAQRLLIALAPNGRDLMAVQVLADIRTHQLPIAPTPQPLQNAVASRYLYGSYEMGQETLVMPNLKSMMQLV